MVTKKVSLILGIFIILALLVSCVPTTVQNETVSPSPTSQVTITSQSSSILPVTTTTPSNTIIPVVATVSPTSTNQSAKIEYTGKGHTLYGDWSATVKVSPGAWQPGMPLEIQTTLSISNEHLAALSRAGFNSDGVCVLVTAERTFDSEGWLRLPSDERMSTLITPTGLAIEGGVQGAVTNRFNAYDFRTPVDEFQVVRFLGIYNDSVNWQIPLTIKTTLPDNLPPGIYRLRLDYGITNKTKYLSLNGETFAYRPFPTNPITNSYIYTPPFRTSGKYADGRQIDASKIQARLPWTILANYNSNGYNGVVAEEDLPKFALSPRNLIPDDVILPLYASDNKTKLSYSLEPQFPTDTIDYASNIPWDYTKGEISIQVTGPDGKTTDLGKAVFVGKVGNWPTTKNAAFTTWKPQLYGQYIVKETGWIADIWGNRYEGGGTYRFWLAKRMTLATATFQGQAYPVGGRYGRDIGFDPAVPANVQVTATLYPYSDPKQAKSISYSGQASIGGVYGSAQGMQPLIFDSPGEYCAKVLATYTDQEGHLWVSSMRHAGVIYNEDSPIVARGKKLTIGGKYVDRGETHFEGWVESPDINHLAHVNYPFQSGDVLLIAADRQGANKIEPVLTYELKNNPAPYDGKLQGIGYTNLKLKTSNGYSPHLFPEYITEWAYYYGAAPRPGFMSRFIVGENGVRAPYWPTSPNSFGGQVNASSNGDLPGVIYRLIGGVVLKQPSRTPVYGGYMSSGFVIPRGSDNNRVIAPGAEDLLGADGTKARLFLAMNVRPGMVYDVGTPFVPAIQIDPILPATVTFKMTYPDGRKVTAKGVGDKTGAFAGTERWTLDIPGVYRYTLEADWQGYKARVPGLPADGGEFYVVEKDLPASAQKLKLNLPEQTSFLPTNKLTITGTSTASTVNFAAVMPGAVIAEGTVPVIGGKFTYTFDPAVVAKTISLYDIINFASGKPEIKSVVQITFFTKETSSSGVVNHSFARVILRGTTVLYAY